LRGAGGWQDAHDLRVGQRWKLAFKRAIGHETGGFIWYGTRKSLSSPTICRLEVPAALRRARRETDGAYPFVPLFVDLSPGRDADAIEVAFGRRRARQLTGLQGVCLGENASAAEFAKRAARRYVRDLVRAHKAPQLRVAITGGRPPTADHDLALDWRSQLDSDGRVAEGAVVPKLVQTLADIRDAAQSQTGCPHIVVEPHLRLPLAVLVGWEWNRVRPIKLTVMQPSSRGLMEVDDLTADPNRWPEPRRWKFDGQGPAVIAVSVGKDLGDSVRRYGSSRCGRSAPYPHVARRLSGAGV
jgi:hypothetical protein